MYVCIYIYIYIYVCMYVITIMGTKWQIISPFLFPFPCPSTKKSTIKPQRSCDFSPNQTNKLLLKLIYQMNLCFN